MFDRDIKVIGVIKEVLYRKAREQITPQVYFPVHRLSAAAGAPAATLQKMSEEVIVVRALSDNFNQHGCGAAACRRADRSEVSCQRHNDADGADLRPNHTRALIGHGGRILCDQEGGHEAPDGAP